LLFADVKANRHPVKQAVKQYHIEAVKVNTLIKPDGEKVYVQLAPMMFWMLPTKLDHQMDMMADTCNPSI
jgi:hypothetical protein